jgi:purine-binding chemotaxis protein CheW
LLGMRPREGNHRKAIVIALVQGRPVGLVVDKLHSITRVSPEALDPVPAVIARRASEAKVNAICRLDSGRRLVSVLDSASLLHGVQSGQLPEFNAMTVSDDRGIAEMTDPFIIFKIGDQTFGLPAGVVKEVVRRPQSLTKIPRSPDFIEGVMNLRGHAVPVIDQRARFGVSSTASARDCIMIVSMGNLQAGFVVDRVRDVLRMRREAVTPAPEMTEGTKIFDRVATFEDGDEIVLLIDPAELLDETERQMLIALRNKASTQS